MPFSHGKSLAFKIDNSGGTLVVLTTFIDSVEFNSSVETADTTTAGAEARTYVSGQSDATLSISGKYDRTATTGPHAVLSGLRGLETTSTFEYGPDGSTATYVKISGECFLTSYVVSSPIGDVVNFSADFQVTGAVTEGVWP